MANGAPFSIEDHRNVIFEAADLLDGTAQITAETDPRAIEMSRQILNRAVLTEVAMRRKNAAVGTELDLDNLD